MKLQTRFHQILVQGMRKRIIPNKTKEAREWYRKAVKEMQTGSINVREFINNQGEHRPKVDKKGIEIGAMYLYNYSPKHKDTLPVYDTFPLVFFFNQDAKHLWGLNFHYLTLKDRAALLDALYTVASDKRFNQKTKVNISWNIIKSVADKKHYQEAVHCYLKSHIKSRLKLILPVEWDLVIFAPLARFHGKDAAKYRARQ